MMGLSKVFSTPNILEGCECMKKKTRPTKFKTFKTDKQKKNNKDKNFENGGHLASKTLFNS
jgi:hypothetical protein